jgi:hypothetical protein
MEGNAPAISTRGVKQAAFEKGRLTLLLGSGRYEFTAPQTRRTSD